MPDGGPRDPGQTPGDGPGKTDGLERPLLLCGVVSPALYVGTDLLAGSLWPGYSFTDRAISELSALDAPTRPLVVALGLVFSGLLIAFGWGVWRVARTRPLRATAGLLIGLGVLGFAWTPFPIHLPGSAPTLTDAVHTALAGVNVVLYLLAIGSGAFTLGRRFRLFSLGVLATLLAFSAASFLMAGAQVSAQGVLAPPPWFGLIERVDAYASMLWVAVLAITLLRPRKAAAPVPALPGTEVSM